MRPGTMSSVKATTTAETVDLEFWSVPKAIRALDLSKSTAYHLIRTGKLPAVRIGGIIRVDARRLKEMLGHGSG
jgi:excisionase family DNA binding protein